MNSPSTTVALTAHLALLSSISFGGFPTVLPDVRNFVVANHDWMTNQDFANFFALAQAVPGPNMILMMSFVGWKVWGIPGAVASALATSGPPCGIYFAAHKLWDRFRKCVDAVFRGSPVGVVDCLTLNGMLDTIDPSTGQRVRVCLLSVRVASDTFRSLNLAQVEPEQCLRSLKAMVSRAPSELLPVKPIVELDMVDPRFVDTMDVMSGLEQRPNLMELSPTEFEGLM
jgi:Chromate transporter